MPNAFDVGSIVDYDTLVETDFYNDFLRPQKIHYMAGFSAQLPARGALGMVGVG